jgi:hypothetical protein
VARVWQVNRVIKGIVGNCVNVKKDRALIVPEQLDDHESNLFEIVASTFSRFFFQPVPVVGDC